MPMFRNGKERDFTPPTRRTNFLAAFARFVRLFPIPPSYGPLYSRLLSHTTWVLEILS